ncbi:MAG: tetratricopeptide repeat protein [Spirochaetes bacterium]|nr:tetratricopeptide repeat protein [Spirochaetota bacterium]
MDISLLIGVGSGILFIISIILYKVFFSPVKIAKIKQLISSGRFEEAAGYLRKLIKRDPDNPINHYYLAECLWNMKNYNEAKSEYNYLFRYNLETYGISEAQVRFKLADIYLNKNQFDEALKELLLIYNNNPDDLYTCLEIADIFKNKQKWDHALKFYQKALKIDKDNAKAIFSTGEILIEKKQYSIAKKYLQAALKLAPNSPDAQYFYGISCKETSDIRNAIIYLSKVTSVERFALNANFNLGLIYFENKDYQNAVKYFEEALKWIKDFNSNSYLNILYIIADTYYKMNFIDKAIELWEKINSIKSNFRDVIVKLSKFQHLKNDDNIKEFLTASKQSFEEIVQDIIHYFDCKIVSIKFDSDGKFAEAQTIGSTSGWKKIDKLPIYFMILRDISRPINIELVSDVVDKMKTYKSAKAYLIAPSYSLPEVNQYVNQRPIEIINRDQLSKILKEVLNSKKNILE